MMGSITKAFKEVLDNQIKLSRTVNYYTLKQFDDIIDVLTIAPVDGFREFINSYNSALEDLKDKVHNICENKISGEMVIYGLKKIKKQLRWTI